MLQSEFESLTMRAGEHINSHLYKEIEDMYMSDNDYHAAHGGVAETKVEFCKRVYGLKINTANTILRKTIGARIDENRWTLQYNSAATAEKLEVHDRLIAEHLEWVSRIAE